MSNIRNITRNVSGKLVSWQQGQQYFEVLRNAFDKPASVHTRGSQRWSGLVNFKYDVSGVLTEIGTSGFKSPLLHELYIEAGASSTFLAGIVEKARKRNAVSRLMGISSASAASTSITRITRLEAEASFSRVRFHLYSEGGAATVFRALAASTETASTANADLISHPTVGGVSYPALRASDGAPGWATVTVGGAANFDFPGVASAGNPKVLTTDWVNVRSVPRTDGGVRPMLMMRVYHDGAVNGEWASGNVSSWVSGTVGYSWARIWESAIVSANGDGVTNPALEATALATTGLWVAVEFDYDVPALTVMGIGDSHFETHGGNAPGVHANFLFQACAQISTPSRPVSLFNNGFGGALPSAYGASGLVAIAAHAPSIVVYYPISSNFGAMTQAYVNDCISRLAQVSAATKAVGARLVILTGVPFPTASTPDVNAEALRLSVTSHCAGLAAAGLVTHIDVESVLSTGSYPARMSAATGTTGDVGSTHFNQTGSERINTILVPILAKLICEA